MYRKCQKPGNAVITFDDGPSPYTNKILDILKANNVKATFFITGKKLNSNESRETFKRILNEGHIIGSHTWFHKRLNETSDEDIVKEMTMTYDLFVEISSNYILIFLLRQQIYLF